MWKILLVICIFSLSKLSNAQQQPKVAPPQITNFLAEDKVAPEEVKFRIKDVWQLVLPCRATGSNPLKWIWKHNNVEINKNKFIFDDDWELLSDGTLKARGLNISDRGTYQCFVEDTVTKVSTFSRKLRVEVTAVGEFKNHQTFTKSTKLGKPLDVACPQRGPSFGVTFAWTSKKARSIQFPISNRVAIDPSTGNLHIMYITQEDVSNFNNLEGIRCTISAANTFYSSGTLTLQILPGKETKLSSPSFTSSTSSRNERAVEGRSKNLYCEATARPPPKLVWKKNGIELKSGNDFIEIPEAFEGRLLSITRVRESLHETTFTCEASNNQTIATGPAKRNFILNVEVAPRWTSKAPDSLKEIPTSSNGNLSCDVYAQPEPVIKWYRDGTEITQSSLKIEVNGSKLLFRETTLDGAGIYQCVAENVHGMIVSSTYVKVLEAPFPPTNLELSSDCQNGNAILSWVTDESNVAPILYFLIERKLLYAYHFWEVIANVTNPNATSHPLVNLSGNADLAFRIRAVNRFGPSPPSEPTVSFCRTIQAAPEKWPDNLRGIPGKAEELTIAWTDWLLFCLLEKCC